MSGAAARLCHRQGARSTASVPRCVQPAGAHVECVSRAAWRRRAPAATVACRASGGPEQPRSSSAGDPGAAAAAEQQQQQQQEQQPSAPASEPQPSPPPPQQKQSGAAAQSASSPEQQLQQQQAAKQPPRPKSAQQQPPRRAKARAQPPLLLRWLRALVGGLARLQATLGAFLLGGAGAALLLYGWARGSPLRRSHPYRFTMHFTEASKLDAGTPVRMNGVQIGSVVAVSLRPQAVEALAEVADAANVIPLASRVDINLLGLAADPWIDITPPRGAAAAAAAGASRGPHAAGCAAEGLVVCHGGAIAGHQGGSTDFMMKFFLSQHDRTRVKTVDTLYHSKQA